MDQPTGGGGTAITKFFGRPNTPQGSWLQLQVQRDLTYNDVKQQTDSSGNLQFFKTNGQPDMSKPKLVLIIQTNVLQSSDGSHPQVFTEGTASVWVKGVTRDALIEAMRQAGVQQPEKVLGKGFIGGAVITMVSAGEKPANRPGDSATKLYNFQYQPGGHEHLALAEDPTQAAAPATPGPAPSAPPQTVPANVPPQQYAPQPPAPAPVQYAAPTEPPVQVPAPPTAAGYPPPAPGVPPSPPQGYVPQVPPAPPQLPPGPPMDPEKQATLLRLQGGQG